MTVAPTIHLPPGVSRDIFVPKPQKLRLLQPPALTASAVRVTKGNGQDFRRLIQPWQARALSYYDMIGEVWYSAQFYARALGKTRLFPALLDENGDPQPTDDPLLNELWDRVQGPGGGRAHLQEQYGRLMFLTGEGYLTATPDEDWGEVWEFLSSDELRVQPGGVFVRYSAPQLDAITYVDAPDDAFEPIANQSGPDAIVPYRLWRPSPRYSAWADSPMRAVLDICEEVVLLTLAVRSRAKSRAANGGLLLWPQNASMPQLDTSGSEDATNDPFAEEIGESMMAPISDPGTASAAVPMIVFMDAQYIQEKDGGPRLMQLVDPKDNYGETGLRNEAIRRFALGVDMPPEQLLGMGDSNHWPCDEATEVFTIDRGFVTHDQLAAGDLVMSLDHDTGTAHWAPLAGVRREHVVDREMVRVQTANLDALTTPDHKWPVVRDGKRVWTDAEHLRPSDHAIRAADHVALPEEPYYSDDFVRLVAWYISEGTCTWPSARHCQVRIGQSHLANPEMVGQIRTTLHQLHGPAVADMRRPAGLRRGAITPPAWREDAEPRGMTLFHLNKAAYAPLLNVMSSWRSKVATREFIFALTKDQLEIFLRTFALGDGHLHATGGLTVNQRDPERLAPVALAAILAGRPIAFKQRHVTGGFSDGIQHHLNAPLKGATVPFGTTTRETYTGVIFCPKVPPSRSFLARRNGTVYFTGNSSWQVDEQSYKAHLQPVTERMCEDFNSSYLRRAARDAGYRDWKKVAIGYDATEVINHPDKGKDFMDMYDRRVVSKAALRRAKGAEDDDAMPDDELKESIGVAVRDGSLALYGIPQVRGTGIEPEPGEIEGTSGTVETAPAGPATGADVEKGPPVAGETEASRPITAAADRIAGAAEMAVERCRELAGQRLVTRVKNRKCQSCIDTLNGNPLPSLVASLLGAETLQEIGAPEPLELVAGGTQSFVAAAVRLGVGADQVSDLADLVELHAARTLYDANPPALPAAFHSIVQRLTR